MSDIERWLDHAFFAGLEISMLSIPALVLLLGASPPGPVALAALTAVGASTCAAGTFRGPWVDLGEWPAPGDLRTMPLRSAYYSATVGVATYAGAAAHLAVGAGVAGIAVSSLVSVAAMAALPRVVGRFRTLAYRFGTPEA
ncbi:hypothetical protein M0R89_00825 [Halorussus limi]|uniref:DUF8215 domain-containing protein n=1 Tax=Halorussus limi TaxID=2938695 RepID=A0A8U0HUM2_9EURY|nr:hypothetical protein [Halorussus limi]UPV74628.1 hypothetical protein M0R89_00825 [Halorussus limi]